SELTCAYATQALSASEVAMAEAHIASCPDYHRELESLRPVVERFVAWPADVLRPTASLQLGERPGARSAHRSCAALEECVRWCHLRRHLAAGNAPRARDRSAACR